LDLLLHDDDGYAIVVAWDGLSGIALACALADRQSTVVSYRLNGRKERR
jgi:hypothetical protein